MLVDIVQTLLLTSIYHVEGWSGERHVQILQNVTVTALVDAKVLKYD